MSRILYTWELGDGYGHTNCVLPLARELSRRGHQITFALKDLSHAQVLLGNTPFSYVQSPLWLPLATGLPSPPLSYSEILHRFGYLDPQGLGSMVRAWRQLYQLVQPDLLIADHAPTALLAASGLGVPRTLMGNGFFSPLRLNPMPNLRPWLDVPQSRLVQSDAVALITINQVLAELELPPLHCLSDLFAVEEDFLCTFAELDHYPNREFARYWGPVFSLEGVAVPEWPIAPGLRLFAYLHHRHRDFQSILQALHRLPNPVLIHAPGIPESLVQRYQTETLRFSTQPLNMAQVRQTCDVGICHAGHGTTTALLLAGIPLLLLPMHLEAYLLSQRVVELGAGLLVSPEASSPDYAHLIQQLLENPTFAERARAFASRYADFDQTIQLGAMADRCEELMQVQSPLLQPIF